MHVYWILSEPFEIKDEQDREKAREALGRLHAFVESRFAQQEWHIDKTSDLARLLRVPGSGNTKPTRLSLLRSSCSSTDTT